ncbi:hypothetical protein ACP70R_043846 [Stipagrostis hirtigluma subsp. patula]
MDAAVSLHHHHGALLPLHAPLPPPHHHHRALPLPLPLPQPGGRPSISSSSKPPQPAAPLTLPTARPTSPPRSSHAVPAAAAARSSSRAATGYAAALADACVRAGTLRRASAQARALLSRRHKSPEAAAQRGELDARVAALVRMLAGKGKAGMVAEVMAEFAAICDHLLLPPPPRPRPRAC